jgi:WD40 repeat protein
VSKVSKALHFISTDAKLWHRICIINDVPIDYGIEKLWARSEENRGKWWREIYIDWYTKKINWERGIYKKRLQSFVDPQDAITCFNYNGEKIIICTDLGKLQSHDFDDSSFLPENPVKMNFEASNSAIICSDLCKNAGNLLVTGELSGQISVWNLFTGDLICLEKLAHDNGTSCVKILGRNRIVSAGFDRTIRVFQLDPLAAKRSDSDIFIPNQEQPKYLRKIGKIWRKAKIIARRGKLELKTEYKGHNGAVYCLEILETSQKIASGSTDKTIKIWSLLNSNCLMTLKGHKDTITCLASKWETLYSGSLDMVIRRILS